MSKVDCEEGSGGGVDVGVVRLCFRGTDLEGRCIEESHREDISCGGRSFVRTFQIKRNSKVMLGQDIYILMGDRVVGREEDDRTTDGWDSGEGGPPLSHEVGVFGVPWRKWVGVGVGVGVCIGETVSKFLGVYVGWRDAG